MKMPAKSLISEPMSVEISLMYKETKKGAVWDTHKTGAQSDFIPFTTTR